MGDLARSTLIKVKDEIKNEEVLLITVTIAEEEAVMMILF